MTYPQTSITGAWPVPTWPSGGRSAVRRTGERIEHAVIGLLVVVLAWLLWLQATAEDVPAASARDACVTTAVHDARAFAAVLGDDRTMPVHVAQRWCRTR